MIDSHVTTLVYAPFHFLMCGKMLHVDGAHIVYVPNICKMLKIDFIILVVWYYGWSAMFYMIFWCSVQRSNGYSPSSIGKSSVGS